MEVRQTKGIELRGHEGELFTVVGRAHVVEPAIGGEANTHATGRPFGRYCLNYLSQEAEAISDAATVAIGTVIRL